MWLARQDRSCFGPACAIRCYAPSHCCTIGVALPVRNALGGVLNHSEWRTFHVACGSLAWIDLLMLS